MALNLLALALTLNIQTAKANGLVPFEYFQHRFEELLKKHENIDHLLLWNVALTDS